MTHPEDLDWPEALLNARVRFWMCINRDHKSVTWEREVATCPDCGVTSEMTTAYARRYVERERTTIAEQARSFAAQLDRISPDESKTLRWFADQITKGRGDL